MAETTSKETGKPSDARLREVLGTYLVFREADLAVEASELDRAEFTTLSRALRERVATIWREAYPGQEPAVFAWLVSRLDRLAEDRVLPAVAVGPIRESIAAKAGGDGKGEVAGPLATIWRTHYLYMTCQSLVEQGTLDAAVMPSLKAALHLLVWRTFHRHAEEQEQRRDRFLQGVQSRGLELLRTCGRKRVITPATLQALELRLSVMISDQGGPDRPADVRCPVCGEPVLLRPAVKCRCCETPHHSECWAYNQGCATFACFSIETCGEGADRPSSSRSRPTSQGRKEPTGDRGAAPATAACPSCGRRYSDRAIRCWSCGKSLKKAAPSTSGGVVGGCVAMLGLILMVPVVLIILVIVLEALGIIKFYGYN